MYESLLKNKMLETCIEYLANNKCPPNGSRIPHCDGQTAAGICETCWETYARECAESCFKFTSTLEDLTIFLPVELLTIIGWKQGDELTITIKDEGLFIEKKED